MNADGSKRARTIATFYSFQGGTGRSMALSNIACLLGRGADSSGRTQTQPGLIDYFCDLKRLLDGDPAAKTTLGGPKGAAALDRLLPLSRYIVSSVGDGLDLMTAGRFDSGYQKRVASFDWAAFHRGYHEVFRAVREHFTAAHSWCLIDSRTGLTDVSGVCTMLPEKLVAVFTPTARASKGCSSWSRSPYATACNPTIRARCPYLRCPAASLLESCS
jgi:hypothetical protein